MIQFFISGGQSIGVSASASVLPMNIQYCFPLEWTGWISFQSKGLLSLLQHHSSKQLIRWHSAFFIVQTSHPYMTTGKTIALTRWTLIGKVMSLLFNMLFTCTCIVIFITWNYDYTFLECNILEGRDYLVFISIHSLLHTTSAHIRHSKICFVHLF